MRGVTQHMEAPQAQAQGLCHTDLDAEPRQNGHALPVLNAAPEPAVDPDDPIYQACRHTHCCSLLSYLIFG